MAENKKDFPTVSQGGERRKDPGGKREKTKTTASG